MKKYTLAEAQDKLEELVTDVTITHKPVLITSQTSNAILLRQDDWDAIMETLYLLSKPNMQTSIISGMRENHRGLPTDLDW